MSAARQAYEQRLSASEATLASLDARDRVLSWLRLGVFLLSLLALALAFWVAQDRPLPFYLLASAGVPVFLILVYIHQRVAQRQRTHRELVRINREALARLDRAWDSLPQADAPAGLGHETTARDLQLFGRGSLYQLLGPPATHQGREQLAHWLVHRADPATITERQQTVAELAPQLDARQALHLRSGIAARFDPSAFLAWAEGDPWLSRRAWLIWLTRFLPVLLILSIAAQAMGLISVPLWMSLVLVNVVVSFGFGERIHGVFDRVADRQDSLAAYERPLAAAAALEGGSPLLTRLRERLDAPGHASVRAMRRLSRIVGLAQLHHSPMTYLPLQALTLWDFHVLAALERWQGTSGRSVRRWLESLGAIEALSSLAGLAHDNPEWTMPRVGLEDAGSLVATGLGHPLLADAVRVSNDVTVGPPGTFLLVTGSNMSGKSTLLRAIGINATLAQAGGPACATSLRMPPLEIATSVVIEDSLTDGVSFFLAELRRLKEIVEVADHLRGRRDVRVLYLLDEILRGTNSVERRIAAQRVIQHLLGAGAIGAVSTHDIALACDEALTNAAVSVHFQETIHGDDGGMTFDYLLRPGLATTTNALKLLELVGLTSLRVQP